MLLRIAVSNLPTPVSVPMPVTPVPSIVPVAFPTLGNIPNPINPIILQTDQQSQLLDIPGGNQVQTLQGLIRQTADSGSNNGQLIIGTEDGVINTPFGDLYLKAGAVVFLIETASGATIYNLHDDHEDSVNLVVDGKKIPIPIGAFAMSTNSDEDFDNLNPAKVLATRGLTDSKLNNGKHIHSGEFSLMSALLNIAPLAELRRSQAPNERKIIAQIMQDAAILMTLTARNGAYTASSEQ